MKFVVLQQKVSVQVYYYNNNNNYYYYYYYTTATIATTTCVWKVLRLTV
jgi:hypothetical protein